MGIGRLGRMRREDDRLARCYGWGVGGAGIGTARDRARGQAREEAREVTKSVSDSALRGMRNRQARRDGLDQ
jgi:hypothetical protein